MSILVVNIFFRICSHHLEESGLWCKFSQKQFANRAVFEGYQKGKNYQKAKKWYESTFKQICLAETKIERLAAFLEETIEATKEHVQLKFARRVDEGNDEEGTI